MGFFEFLLLLVIALKLMGFVSWGWGLIFGTYLAASLILVAIVFVGVFLVRRFR